MELAAVKVGTYLIIVNSGINTNTINCNGIKVFYKLTSFKRRHDIPNKLNTSINREQRSMRFVEPIPTNLTSKTKTSMK